MPRKNRLTRADFNLLLKVKTRRINGVFFTVTIAPLPDALHSKASCVVSKKIARRAVDRNTIKRRCREAVHPFLSVLKKPVMLMFYAKKESLGAPFQVVNEDVTKIFSQLSM